ncbi:hypothetical protein C9374_012090 [Naegleria lovaniensis]|uniref:Penicillin amidase n=1 Tax=Naegleria lovaniensis TaxID=51637 RepID=A0AA88GEP7_NAELO|nr:uncharacterized protein C9374_012090 [Naegleria lovaniensis]KAG2373483.1 hypothetical protein C9374_012090 [Naegleria lovaniensis]
MAQPRHRSNKPSCSASVFWLVFISVATIFFSVPFFYLIATIPHLIAICNSLFAFVVLSLVGFLLILSLWVAIMLRDARKQRKSKSDLPPNLSASRNGFDEEFAELHDSEDDDSDDHYENYNQDMISDEQSLISVGNRGVTNVDASSAQQQEQPSNAAASLIEETRRNQAYQQTTEYILKFLQFGSFLVYFIMLIGLVIFSVWIGTTKNAAQGLTRGTLNMKTLVDESAYNPTYKDALSYASKFMDSLKKGSVSVDRDANDVIHISAPDEYSLYFTQGYVHAQERLWQIDTLKRTLQGSLSQTFGVNLLFSDRFYLTLGLYEAAQRDYKLLNSADKDKLDAYANGLSFYVKTMPAIPVEYQLIGYKPTVFTGVDILAHHKYLSLTLSGNIYSEIQRYELDVLGLSASRISTILPNEYPNGFPFISQPKTNLNTNITYSTRVTSQQQTNTRQVNNLGFGSNLLDFAKTSVYGLFENILSGVNDLTDIFSSSSTIRQRLAWSVFDPQNIFSSPIANKGPYMQASNNWVISGDYTQGKQPLHANDIHLHLQAPNMFLLMHLKVTGTTPMETIGGSIAGLPCIIIGRNGNGISWSFTNAGADTMDLYELQETEDGSGYIYKGKTIPYTVKSVTLNLKDGGRAIFNITSTQFGPLIAGSLGDSLYPVRNLPKKKRLALRYLDTNIQDTSLLTFFTIPTAKNFDEFDKAFGKLTAPVLHVIYADSNNNIAYTAAGRVPLRTKPDENLGLRPVKTYVTAEEDYSWDIDPLTNQFVTAPYDTLPDLTPTEVKQQKASFIFSANNKPETPSIIRITNDYGLLYARSMRIQSLISNLVTTRTNITLQDMTALQIDSVSMLFIMNRNIFQKMKPFKDEYHEKIRKQLVDWNGDMVPDSKLATIFEYWLKYITKLASNETQYDQTKLPFSKDNSFPPSTRYALTVMQQEISNPSAAVDPNCVKFSSDKTCIGFARDQLEAVLKVLRSKFSFIPAYSSYRIHQTRFTHPLFGAYGLTGCLGTRISRRSGGTDTINEGAPSDDTLSNSFGPAYRQVIDHSNLEASVFIIPMGQSGNIFAKTYDNYLQAWENGEYVPMKTKDYVVKETLSIVEK